MKQYLKKSILISSILVAITMTACSSSPQKSATAEAVVQDTEEEEAMAPELSTEDSLTTTIISTSPTTVQSTLGPKYSINGLSIFSDESLAEVVQTYTADLFTNAYDPYYQILGFDYAFSDIVFDGSSFVLTYGVTMHYQNYYRDPDTVGYIQEAKKHSEEEYRILKAEYNQEKESPFLLRLEGSNGADTDFFSLFYISDSLTSNKGFAYVPIEDILPPVPDQGTITVPLGSTEYFGTITLSDTALTINRMNWINDDTVDDGYYIEQLGTTVSCTLGDDAQITGLYGDTNPKHMAADAFSDYLTQYPQGVYWVYVKNSEAVAIVEQYLP